MSISTVEAYTTFFPNERDKPFNGPSINFIYKDKNIIRYFKGIAFFPYPRLEPFKGPEIEVFKPSEEEDTTLAMLDEIINSVSSDLSSQEELEPEEISPSKEGIIEKGIFVYPLESDEPYKGPSVAIVPENISEQEIESVIDQSETEQLSVESKIEEEPIIESDDDMNSQLTQDNVEKQEPPEQSDFFSEEEPEIEPETVTEYEPAETGTDYTESEISTENAYSKEPEEKTIYETVYEIDAQELIFPPLSHDPAAGPLISITRVGPQKISPANNSTVTEEYPQFVWEDFNAAKYQIFITKYNYGENSLILAKELSDNNYTFEPSEAVEPLQNNSSYAWNVVAYNEDDELISEKLEGTYYIFDMKIQEFDEEKTEITITDIQLNDISLDLFQNEINLTEEDLSADDKIKISALLTGKENIEKVEISFDGGNTYNLMNFVNQNYPAKIEYYFEPKPGIEYEPVIRITTIDGLILKDAYFGLIEKLVYIEENNEEMIKELLDKYVKSLLNNDVTSYMECIGENFIGKNEGYEDYYAIETSVKDFFNKTKTLTCSYRNENIELQGENLAKLTFDFKRQINFTEIDKKRILEFTAEIRLTKTTVGWQITEDINGLLFLDYFAPLPGVPDF